MTVSRSQSNALMVYAAELKKLAKRYQTEDAVAFGLMRQARALHEECQAKLASIAALQKSIGDELLAEEEDTVAW